MKRFYCTILSLIRTNIETILECCSPPEYALQIYVNTLDEINKNHYLSKVTSKMRIEHIAMYVNDLEATKDFFETYFNAKSNEGYHNVNTGFRSYFLTFEGNCRLEIMNKPDMPDGHISQKQTGFIHMAFSVGSKAEVDELTSQLKEGGYQVISGPRTTGDGYYESCIVDIEGNQIEITV